MAHDVKLMVSVCYLNIKSTINIDLGVKTQCQVVA